MKKSYRIGFSAIALVLSLPAFTAVVAGIVLAFEIPLLSGYRGTPAQAILVLTRSFSGQLVLAVALLLIAHIPVFIYLLIRFARGLPLPVLAQTYCLAVALAAIGERIRLEIVDVDVFFWFGVLSLPHVLCLLALIYQNLRPRAPARRPLASSAQA